MGIGGRTNLTHKTQILHKYSLFVNVPFSPNVLVRDSTYDYVIVNGFNIGDLIILKEINA